jgi:hypothetical protein
MVTPAQVRKLALAFPETEEKAHFDQPDFRVRGKIFAGLSPDGKRGNLKLTPDIQATLLGPKSPFAPAAGAWGAKGWTHFDLAHVDLGVLESLLGEAWRLVAPSKLVSALDTRPTAKKKAATKKAAARKPRTKK